jgi:hypothetical protein
MKLSGRGIMLSLGFLHIKVRNKNKKIKHTYNRVGPGQAVFSPTHVNITSWTKPQSTTR